jgi:RHH-type transcriptional regulator, rel operon repressor / antitoxin RelB
MYDAWSYLWRMNMATLSIRIDDGVKDRWATLSKNFGLNQSEIFRQAIVEKLEELEDFYVIKERLSQPFETVSNDDVWKELGIED